MFLCLSEDLINSGLLHPFLDEQFVYPFGRVPDDFQQRIQTGNFLQLLIPLSYYSIHTPNIVI